MSFVSWAVSLAAAKNALAKLGAETISEYELGGPNGKKITKKNLAELEQHIVFLEGRVAKENNGSRGRRVAIRPGGYR